MPKKRKLDLRPLGPASEPGEPFLITPEVAKRILADGHSNYRNMRSSWVDQIAYAILRGDWELNGETIKFDSKGRLVDGQHRLAAIVKANTPAPSYWVAGIDDVINVDGHLRRTLSDYIAHDGHPNSTAMAAMASFAWSLFHGRYVERMTRSGRHRIKGGAFGTRQELLALVDEYIEEWEPALRDASTAATRPFLAPTHLAPFLWVFRKIHRESADEFLEQLKHGGADTHGGILRSRLINERLKQRLVSRGMVGALILKAWAAFYNGQPVPRTLRWRPDKEAYPLIAGLEEAYPEAARLCLEVRDGRR